MSSPPTLPKLDTTTAMNCSRDSYSSIASPDLRSGRSSYAAISDSATAASSARTSYSSMMDSFSASRVASFSRTSGTYVPDSSPESPESERSISPETEKSADEPKAEDGATTLQQLQNVQNIICVAFGAFDRYFISWEDTEGEFHQESSQLPPKLQAWLSPQGGGTRHLPSVQVSFGSNDEFFASDQDGKLSSRDSLPTPIEKKSTPTLAQVARGIMREKSNTISSPGLPVSAEPESPLQQKKVSPRIERRMTFPEERTRRNSSLTLNLVAARGPRREFGEKRELPGAREVVHVWTSDLVPESTESAKQASSEASSNTQPTNPAISRIDERLGRLSSKPEPWRSHQRKLTLIGTPRAPADPTPVASFPSLFSSRIPPIRPSWPDRRSLLIAKEREQQAAIEAARIKAVYVDAAVQTDVPLQEPFPVVVEESSVPAPPIGSFSDFFGSEYRLGDALRYV